MTTATHELWERLQGVLTLRFTASRRAEYRASDEADTSDGSSQSDAPHTTLPPTVLPHTGWRGVGNGIVDVYDATPDTLLFKEVGLWRQSGGRELRFTNIFRWSRGENHLRLDHLRQGLTRPIFLFDLAPDAQGVWRETAPHPCRADFYSAMLRLEGDQIRVNWRITGPRKDEVIEYVYL